MSYTNDLVTALNEIVLDTKWQKLGSVEELRKNTCRKLYVDPEDEDMVVQPDDIVLFSIDNGEKFYAIDCSCPHEGGPLDLGDIEDIGGGELAVICPWHSYDFSLTTGKSMTGLTTNVYDVRVMNNDVFINCDHKLSLTPVLSSTQQHDEGEQKESIPCSDETPTEGKILNENSLTFHARKILTTADPEEKARLSHQVYEDIRNGRIQALGCYQMPDEPSRQEGLDIKDPGRIKRGRGGTLVSMTRHEIVILLVAIRVLCKFVTIRRGKAHFKTCKVQQSRIALLHSLANIEQWAIDLAWDIIGRFASFKIDGECLPMEFFEDFAKVANDEAKHFKMINERLKQLDSHFGALPVHNGLWQSADETSHDLLARLAIVHMVHEARGLDVHPKTSDRFASQNDKESVALMHIIYTDEITHVACGMKWFTYICQRMKPPLEPVPTFHQLVKKHFKGYLKPPFNTSGRSIAGMKEEWYTPLVKPTT